MGYKEKIMPKELIIESKKHGTHTVLIDEEDWEKISEYRWHLWSGPTNNTIYARVSNMGTGMHRIILNAPKGTMIDHINGNGLDNRKENLRFCTKRENNANQKKNINNSSGYKGVAKASNYSYSKWRAYIRVDYKQIHLGNHNTPEEAARAYDVAAKKYFGEYAHLNFPDKENH